MTDKETETPATADEIIKQLKEDARKIADSSYQRGFDAASAEQDLRYWTGGKVTQGGNAERSEAAYQAELRPVVAALRAEGVRGSKNLQMHPRVREVREKHGR